GPGSRLFRLLHSPKRVALMHFGNDGKIVMRRRRRNRPLKRSAVPGIASGHVLFPVAVAHVDLPDLSHEAEKNQNKTYSRDDEERLPLHHCEVIEPSCRAHESEEV